ncbi:MAG: hypothetical protein JNK58_03180 [Phycisphaerae bacterium]|nr:hypothetical protein [Phycisphaerae bacterium]
MSRESWCRRVLPVVVLACLAAGRLVCGQVEVEEDEAGSSFENGETRTPPSVSRNEVTFFVRAAGLSAEQREAALELWATYAERHAAAADKFREYAEAVTGGERNRGWQDDSIRKQLMPVRMDLQAFERQIEDQLKSDLRQVLTPEQESRAGWFQRRTRVRAHSNLVSWSYAGEADLALIAHLVTGSGAWSEELSATLDKYYGELLDLIEEAQKDQEAALSERKQDHPAGEGEAADDGEAAAMREQARWREQRKRGDVFRLRGAQLNERYAARIASMVPSEQSERFEERYLRAMTSRRSTPYSDAGPVFDRALLAEGLSEDQRARLMAMRGEWSKEERRRLRDSLKQRLASLENGDDESEAMLWSDDVQERMKKQAATLAAVRGVLTEEQAEAAGPPLSKSTIRIPDFDAEDEPEPARSTTKGRTFDMEGLLSMRSLTSGDIAYYTRVAGLDADQREAAADLLASYTSRQRRAVRKMAAYQSALTERLMQGDTGESMQKRATQVYLRFDEYTKRLTRETLDDLKSILTDEQSGAYDRLEKRLRRRTMLNPQVGMISAGAGLDLVSLLEGVVGKSGLPAEAEPTLERYEREMAPAVDRLRQFEEDQIEKAKKLAEGAGEMDPASQMASAMELMTQMQKIASEARDLNIRYFREVLPMLPEAIRPEAERAFYLAASPFSMMNMMDGDESSRRTPQGLFDEAAALDDLTDEQRSSLSAALLSYTKQASAKYREVFDMLVQMEKDHPNMMERMTSIAGSGVYNTEVEMGAKRDEALEAMLASLTAEQRERLPRPYRPPGVVPRPRFDED